MNRGRVKLGTLIVASLLVLSPAFLFVVFRSLDQGNTTGGAVARAYRRATVPTWTSTPDPNAPPTPTRTPRPTETATPVPTPPHVIVGANMNVRAGPGTEYEIIGGAQAGEEFKITGRNNPATWWRISYNGLRGWVFGELVTPYNAGKVVAVLMPTPRAAVASTPTRAPTATRAAAPVVQSEGEAIYTMAGALHLLDRQFKGTLSEWSRLSPEERDKTIKFHGELLVYAMRYCNMSLEAVGTMIDENGAMLDMFGYTTRKDVDARFLLLFTLRMVGEEYPSRPRSCESIVADGARELLKSE